MSRFALVSEICRIFTAASASGTAYPPGAMLPGDAARLRSRHAWPSLLSKTPARARRTLVDARQVTMVNSDRDLSARAPTVPTATEYFSTADIAPSARVSFWNRLGCRTYSQLSID